MSATSSMLNWNRICTASTTEISNLLYGCGEQLQIGRETSEGCVQGEREWHLHPADGSPVERKGGFRGFLMGEQFMKQADPGVALQEFIKQLK